MGKLAAFRRLSTADRFLYFEAVGWLAFAATAKGLLSYKQVKRLLKARGEDPGPEGAAKEEKARRIGRSVTVMSKYVPWPSLCLVQAIAARIMLRLRGIPSTVYVGIARGEENGDLLSHAWLCSGDMFITGEEGRERFKEITSFRE
ncbi:MAG: lasso peptide biosynthesis B2 protein [Acidobacteriota bacterium]|nr:lasso peptide biosynthesis B2 protein [Acidobacteriota bacterium]